MNELQNDIKKVTLAKLSAWGHWECKNKYGRGYPNQAPFRRLIGFNNLSIPHIEDEEAERIDEIVSTLDNVEDGAREVVKLYFVEGRDFRHMESLGFKYSKARELYRVAVSYIMGRLYGMQDGEVSIRSPISE